MSDSAIRTPEADLCHLGRAQMNESPPAGPGLELDLNLNKPERLGPGPEPWPGPAPPLVI
jgi:hypothetical protein